MCYLLEKQKEVLKREIDYYVLILQSETTEITYNSIFDKALGMIEICHRLEIIDIEDWKECRAKVYSTLDNLVTIQRKERGKQNENTNMSIE